MQINKQFNYKNKNLEIKSSKDNIKSHNQMPTFMSGTDLDTLKKEGTDVNHFVSLIVNNVGKYTAGITRKVKSTKTITEKFSYPTYEDGLIQDTKDYILETEEIEWYSLNIEFENPQCSFQEDIDKRLNEIKKSKYTNKQDFFNNNLYTTPSLLDNHALQEIKSVNAELTTTKSSIDSWSEEPNNSTFENSYYNNENKLFEIPYGELTFNKDIIKDLLVQLTTGSVIVNRNSKIDLNKWVKGMPSLYEKRFGKGVEGIELFRIWADNYVEFLCWNTKDEKLNGFNLDEEDLVAILAYDLIEAFSELPSNKFIEEYINILENYLK